MANIAKAYIGFTGQEINCLKVDWAGELPAKEDIRVTGPAAESQRSSYLRRTKGAGPGDICEVSLEEGVLRIETVPFNDRDGWGLEICGKAYTPADFTIKTRTMDEKFERITEGRVMYRLYTPESTEPRPMILFLHGGGNGGYEGERNNEKQLTADFGPVNFAENYPDIYVMAPQCVERRRNLAMMNTNRSFDEITADNEYGWTRSYIALVCDIIRRMIKEGKVDPKRIYVTGMSAGGAATLRAMSVGSDLFAAAVPVCPSMTPETFTILKSIRRPIWVATAYVDHTIYRHKYIVDGVMSMRDNGNDNAHLTIYSPEELAKYDIATDPDISYKDRFSQNHWSWVPTYNNEHGIMSWLLNQTKDDWTH